VIVEVKHPCHADLAHLGEASDALGAIFGFGQGGQEEGCEHADDADDNQEFHQSECGANGSEATATTVRGFDVSFAAARRHSHWMQL
jgi:hypothetical protein